MCIDMSLAKGLRSSILKRVSQCNFNDAASITRVIGKRSSAPETTKGARKLFREIGKVLDKHALMAWPELLFGREAWWVLWDIERADKDGHSGDWQEDKLTACSMRLLLKGNYVSSKVVPGGVKFGMHLIERMFQRLDTTDHEIVIEELRTAALMAMTLASYLQSRLVEKGIDNYPIMIPTGRGAILGDFDVKKGEFNCRTFVGGERAITGAKKHIDIQLGKWGWDFIQEFYRGMACVILVKAEALTENEDRTSKVFLDLADQYISLMEDYNRVTPKHEERTARKKQENTLWALARQQHVARSSPAYA